MRGHVKMEFKFIKNVLRSWIFKMENLKFNIINLNKLREFHTKYVIKFTMAQNTRYANSTLIRFGLKAKCIHSMYETFQKTRKLNFAVQFFLCNLWYQETFFGFFI